MKRLLDRIRAWYEGKYVPHNNDPGSGIFFVGGWYDRSPSARAVRVIFEFWRQHWQWCIGTLIALAGLVHLLRSY